VLDSICVHCVSFFTEFFIKLLSAPSSCIISLWIRFEGLSMLHASVMFVQIFGGLVRRLLGQQLISLHNKNSILCIMKGITVHYCHGCFTVSIKNLHKQDHLLLQRKHCQLCISQWLVTIYNLNCVCTCKFSQTYLSLCTVKSLTVRSFHISTFGFTAVSRWLYNS